MAATPASMFDDHLPIAGTCNLLNAILNMLILFRVGIQSIFDGGHKHAYKYDHAGNRLASAGPRARRPG